MKAVGIDDMYRFLAVFMFSQCFRFILSKIISILSRLDCPVPTLELVTFISSNILAFSATGRGDQGESVWSSQRDQTVRLTEFELTAYRMSCKAFLSPAYTFMAHEPATIKSKRLVRVRLIKKIALMQWQIHCFVSRFRRRECRRPQMWRNSLALYWKPAVSCH